VNKEAIVIVTWSAISTFARAPPWASSFLAARGKSRGCRVAQAPYHLGSHGSPLPPPPKKIDEEEEGKRKFGGRRWKERREEEEEKKSPQPSILVPPLSAATSSPSNPRSKELWLCPSVNQSILPQPL